MLRQAFIPAAAAPLGLGARPRHPAFSKSLCPGPPVPPYTHLDQRHCHRARPGRLIFTATASNQFQQQPRLVPLQPAAASPAPAARVALTPASAHAALAIVAAFYGVFTCVCRFLANPASVPALAGLPTLPAHVFNIARLVVSSLFSVFLLLRRRTSAPPPAAKDAAAAAAPRPSLRRLIASGVELGAWNLGVNIAVVTALSHTAAPRVAFLAQTQIVLVPLAALLFPSSSKSAPPATPASRVIPLAVLAFVGSALLSCTGASAAGAGSSFGDFFAVLSSIFSTIIFLRSQALMRSKTPLPSAELTAVKNITQGLLAIVHLAVTARPVFLSVVSFILAPAAAASVPPAALLLNVALVLFGGIAVNFFGAWVKIASLEFVAAGNAALILAFAPVVTAVIAALVMGEVLTGWALIGSACILCASFATLVLSSKPKGRQAETLAPRRQGRTSVAH